MASLLWCSLNFLNVLQLKSIRVQSNTVEGLKQIFERPICASNASAEEIFR